LGEGDAAGLAAGLGLFTGALSVALAGELDVAGDGLVALGVSELPAGSQAAANTIENVASSRSAMRLIKLMLGFFIIFPSFQQN